MPPPHVTNLEDYYWWLEKRLSHVAGYLLDTPSVDARFTESEPGIYKGLHIGQHRLSYFDDESSILTFAFALDADLNMTEYSFDYRRGGRLIWRKDKQRNHHHECHIHLDPDEDRRGKYDEVEMEEVLDEIEAYRERGELPQEK